MLAAASPAQTNPDAWEGLYNPIPIHANPNDPFQHCCEIAHAILIGKPGSAQGKVLLIQSNGSRWLWDPAAPSSVGRDVLCDVDVEDNLFCSVHSANGQGDIVIHGGERYKDHTLLTCTPQPRFSYVYAGDGSCWSNNFPMLVPNPPQPPLLNSHNLGYYYPGSLRTHNGFVISVGGGSAPLTSDINNLNTPSGTCGDTYTTYFVDGWQTFDPAQGGWSGLPATAQQTQLWRPGLPGQYQTGGITVDFDFNYYPLLSLIPANVPVPTAQGFVFAPVVTDNRSANYESDPNPSFPNTPYASRRSPSAIMTVHATWPANGSWNVASQINEPGTTTPRNLYYPSGFLWPIDLNSAGLPTTSTRFVVLGGTDQNKYLTGTLATGTANQFPAGGRPALDTVYSIDQPESGSAWTTGMLPSLTHARIFTNAVVLPNKQLFVVGGSRFDFLPFRGQFIPSTHPNYLQERYKNERIADPIFVAEMIDLTNPLLGWVTCPPHISPRLYHSIALLLPDGRVLVGGGYRGKKPPPGTLPQNMTPAQLTWHNWLNEHSDFEIFSPDYLFAGARPQILSITGGNTIGYGNGSGSTFEISVALPGSANPAQDISSACLISPGSVTHQYDWDQRFVGLPIAVSGTSTKKMVVTAPADRFAAPPGWYAVPPCDLCGCASHPAT